MRHPRRHRPMVALLGLVPLTLVGCDKPDPVAQALADVERDLAEVHPGGTASADPATREAVYRAAIPALRVAGQSGTEAQQDAAGLLIAAAEEGLARLSAADAARREARLVDLAARLRASADLSLSELALARALASETGQTQRAELQTAIAEGRRRVEEARSERESLTAERAALMVRAEGHAARAAEHTAEAGRIRSQALDAASEAVADLAQRAYEAQRRAAEEGVAASRLRAQAERLDPMIAEQSLLVESVQAEVRALNEALDRVAQRVRDAEASAQTAQASARSSASDAASILDRFEALRAEADDHWAQAVTHAQAAIAAISRARGIERGTLAIRRGETHQRLGEMLDARRRGLERSADQIRLLLGFSEPLPFADRLEGLASSFEASASEAGAGAAEALAEAVRAYEGASTREASVRDRLSRVRALLAGAGDAPAAPADTNPDDSGSVDPDSPGA